MEGITVLHEYMVGGVDLVSQLLLILVAVVLVAVAIYGAWQKFIAKRANVYWSAIIAPLVGALVVAAVALFVSTVEPVPTYKVTIDNSVSYREFIENYELIGREGEIFIIREIEKGE